VSKSQTVYNLKWIEYILTYIYIYILYLYIIPGCIQYRECTQAEPTRQEHLVRANRPTQAEPTLCLRPSRTLPNVWLQSHHTRSCNHFCLTEFPRVI
jgi:hypothetical protein